jgi:signal transduction histidine kinase
MVEQLKLSLERRAGPHRRIYVSLFLGILGLGILVGSLAFADTRRNLQMFPLFGMASLVILLGMAGLYYYAYKFYKDEFYALVGVGWFGNAIYILFETIVKTDANLQFALYVYLFSQVSFVPFYIAGSTRQGQALNYKRLFAELGGWFTLSLFAVLGGKLWLRSHPQGASENIILWAVVVSGLPYAIWTLVSVGRSLRSRLSPTIHGTWADLFPSTFYWYAGLQPFYLLKLSDNQALLKVAFGAALCAKILNSVGAFAVILRDFESVRAELGRKSAMEDLGALTASIEHEIKNPVQNVNNYVNALERQFQARSEVVAKLDHIKEETARIFAVTQIIKILRGDDYYQQMMQKVSVSDLIDRSVRAVKVEFNCDGIHFVSSGGTLYAKALRPTLQQAFVNVLKNSVEAIREANRNSGLIAIEWKEHAGETVIVRISDNGCGIPASILPTLGQFVTTKSAKKPNSGVGLFISKRILRMHRGSLELESDEGSRTTVSLVLPVWKDKQ